MLWYVGLGAAAGGIARYLLAAFVQQRAGVDFPVGTLLINITGSFLLGCIMRYALQTAEISPELRAMLTTGFCGGYTTFSTFSYDTALLLEEGEDGRAILYIGASVLGALLFTFLGFAVASRFLAMRSNTP
jgi:CrcB protein